MLQARGGSSSRKHQDVALRQGHFCARSQERTREEMRRKNSWLPMANHTSGVPNGKFHLSEHMQPESYPCQLLHVSTFNIARWHGCKQRKPNPQHMSLPQPTFPQIPLPLFRRAPAVAASESGDSPRRSFLLGSALARSMATASRAWYTCASSSSTCQQCISSVGSPPKKWWVHVNPHPNDATRGPLCSMSCWLTNKGKSLCLGERHCCGQSNHCQGLPLAATESAGASPHVEARPCSGLPDAQ